MCANKMYVTYNTEKPAITIQGAFYHTGGTQEEVFAGIQVLA